jgi:hypothetical protein
MEGRLAYASGATITDDSASVASPDNVRMATMLPASEIDLSEQSAILTPALAEAVVRSASQHIMGLGDSTVALQAEPGATSSEGAVSVSRGTDGEPTAPRPGERLSRLRLTLHVTGDEWFPLQRALSSLREQSEHVVIDLDVTATSSSSDMDPSTIRNGVIEPLEEAGIEVRQDRS